MGSLLPATRGRYSNLLLPARSIRLTRLLLLWSTQALASNVCILPEIVQVAISTRAYCLISMRGAPRPVWMDGSGAATVGTFHSCGWWRADAS